MRFTSSVGLQTLHEVEGRGESLVLYHGPMESGQWWRDAGYTIDVVAVLDDLDIDVARTPWAASR